MSRVRPLGLLALIPVLALAQAPELMWARHYWWGDASQSIQNRAMDMCVDGTGNVYVCGAGEYGRKDTTDFLLVKYNPDGETLWVRALDGTLPSSEMDCAHSLCLDQAGNVYVVGVTENATEEDATWAKYSGDGALLWEERSSGPGEDYLFDVAVDEHGHLFACGTAWDDFDYVFKYLVMLIDATTGDTLWTHTYGPAVFADRSGRGPRHGQDRHPDFHLDYWDYEHCANALATFPGGDSFAVTGYRYSDVNEYQIWTMKFQVSGNTLVRHWQHRYDRMPAAYCEDDIGYDVAVSDLGVIYVAGFDFHEEPVDQDFYYDFCVLGYLSATGSTGPQYWAHLDGDEDDDMAHAVCLDDASPQNVYATGYGWFTGVGDQVWTHKFTASLGYNNTWTAGGARYGGLSWDYGYDICYHDHRIYVAGQLADSMVVLCYTDENTAPNPKYELWDYVYNASGDSLMDWATAVCIADTGHIYFAGQSFADETDALYSTMVTARLGYPFHDVAAVAIVSPSGTIPPGPAPCSALVSNYGDVREPVDVTFSINSSPAYQNTVSLPNGLPFTDTTIGFPDWNAMPGSYIARCSVYLATDQVPENDTVSLGFLVSGQFDMGVDRIVAPVGAYDTMALFAPEMTVTNYGDDAVYDATFRVFDPTDALVYDSILVGQFLSQGSSVNLVFPAGMTNLNEGDWTTEAFVYVPGDTRPGNDTAFGEFIVATGPTCEPGWHEILIAGQSAVPLVPSAKAVKQGGWLAYHGTTDDEAPIFVHKGYKTTDFYAYHPVGNYFVVLSGMPYSTHPNEKWARKAPYKGCKGVQVGNVVYVTQGNNTLGFWSYHPQGDSWHVENDVPVGPDRKKVKGGTDMAYVPAFGPCDDYIYLVKGYRCEFYRFNLSTKTWDAPLEQIPTGMRQKMDKGSWCSYNHGETSDAHLVYVFKSKYNELYAYYIQGDSFHRLADMPFRGWHSGKIKDRKKSKDGGCASYWNGQLYALKGGNTQQFFQYFPVGDTWHELDTLPNNGSTGKKKRVKYGADIISIGNGCFYALKGNKTRELWRYGATAFTAEPRPQRSGVAGAGVSSAGPSFSLTLNPLRSGTAIRYSTGPALAVSARLFDVTGRQVWSMPRRWVSGTGTLPVRTEGLTCGAYVLQVSAGDAVHRFKLVIE